MTRLVVLYCLLNPSAKAAPLFPHHPRISACFQSGVVWFAARKRKGSCPGLLPGRSLLLPLGFPAAPKCCTHGCEQSSICPIHGCSAASDVGTISPLALFSAAAHSWLWPLWVPQLHAVGSGSEVGRGLCLGEGKTMLRAGDSSPPPPAGQTSSCS